MMFIKPVQTRMARKHGYQNRSEALRDIIREVLVRSL